MEMALRITDCHCDKNNTGAREVLLMIETLPYRIASTLSICVQSHLEGREKNDANEPKGVRRVAVRHVLYGHGEGEEEGLGWGGASSGARRFVGQRDGQPGTCLGEAGARQARRDLGGRVPVRGPC